MKPSKFTPAAVPRPAQEEFAGVVIRSALPARPAGPPLGSRPGARAATSGDVLAASWCRSVGATWTLELRSVGEAAPDTPVDWICSGVPTQQPAPDRHTADLLRERGLLLFPVAPVDSVPRTRSRRLIGYVTSDAEVMRLALMLTDVLDARHDHPMVLAARWVQAGYPADVAAQWITAGLNWPKATRVILPH